MGNSIYLDELIVSYLSDELNEEEVAFVLAWVNSSEENKRHFEELKSIWNLTATKKASHEVDVEVEWNNFKGVITHGSENYPSSQESNYSNEVYEKVIHTRREKIFRVLMAGASAASIILFIGFAWKFLDYNKSGELVASTAFKETPVVTSSLRNRINTSTNPLSIALPDGSNVILFGKSRISYHEPFSGNKRDIILVGKANFKVAKDRTKPFTVISGDLATTALGTHFTVTAYENALSIVVKLYEGKVVIKSSQNAKNKLSNDYYLTPGHELVYDNHKFTAKIRNFRVGANVPKTPIKKEAPLLDNPSVPDFGKGTWYMFNNQPLSMVFDQLEQMFGIVIKYSKRDVSKIYFIGSFSQDDSLDQILKQIAAINNLKIFKKDNKIIITK